MSTHNVGSCGELTKYLKIVTRYAHALPVLLDGFYCEERRGSYLNKNSCVHMYLVY